MRRVIATALAALLATGGLARASDVTLAKPDADAALTRTVAVASAANLAGEILIVDAEGGAAGAALGLADREAKRRHVRGERWLWASVTKQVTARTCPAIAARSPTSPSTSPPPARPPR